MADQPLNVDIQIFRQLRSQREIVRHDVVKNLTGYLRKLVLVVPGDENRTSVVARDTGVTDFSAFMGEARGRDTAGALIRGLPVVIGARQYKEFKTINTMTGIDFPINIGSDKFVVDNAANVGSDLFQAAADATAGTHVPNP